MILQPTQRQVVDGIYGVFGLDLELALAVNAALSFARESVENGTFPVGQFGTMVTERLMSMESK